MRKHLATTLIGTALAAAISHAQITVDDSRSFTTSPSNTLQRTSTYTFQTDGTFDPALQASTIPGALGGFDPTGSDKIVVTFSGENLASVASVSYGGAELSQAVVGSNGSKFTRIYYLDNPPTVGDLVFNFSSSGNGVGGSILALSGTVAGAPTDTASEQGSSATLTTTAAHPVLVASHVHNGGGGTTVQPPFTIGFSDPTGSAGGASAYLNPAPAGSYTVTFDGSTDSPATVLANFSSTVPIQPTPNGGIIAGGPVELAWQNLAPSSGSDVWVDVWFGTDPLSLTQVVSADPDGLNRNTFTTDPLTAGTYYWRVDSYLDGSPTGTPETGTLLSFTIIDTDADGLPDDWEMQYSDPSSPTALDPADNLDGDTLTNLEEFELGTNPTVADTDGDGLDDHVETDTGTFVDASNTGTDPLNPDSDGDGFVDGVETDTGTWVSATDTGTDPLAADTDRDGLLDGVESNTGSFVSSSDTGSNPHDTDSDGDGSGDWYEVTATYTDPTDSSDGPGVPYPLPDPDPADTGDATKPVKVYIMSGQSNMVGIGYVSSKLPGSLNTITRADHKFPNLIDDTGAYTERNDVIYSSVVTDRANNGPLTANQGGGNDRVGPELGFGHVMGWFHDEPVLLVKASQGNRSLGWDYLPPGSERFEVGDLTYAGYGDRPESWLTASEGPVPGISWGGKEYDLGFRDEAEMGATDWVSGFDYVRFNVVVKHNGALWAAKEAHVSSPSTEPGVGADWETVWEPNPVFNAADVLRGDGTLQNLPTAGNDLNGRSYEIAGFVWWQGHKDGGEEGVGEASVYASRYEQNLTQLIESLRSDFDAPNAPVVVATIGFGGGGWDPGSSGDTIYKAQLAVGDPAQYPAFEGTVASVDTTGYWRTVAESPGGQGFHYNNNAETYTLVGDAMARAMIELQADETAPTPNPSSFLIPPGPAGSGSVGMIATTANDLSGPVEYFFENLTSGGTSGWITNPEWTDTGLADGVPQTYRVRTRDALGNTGDWSAEASAAAGADTTAPTPDPMSFASPPAALGETAITMTAATALDLNGVEYFFACTAGGGPDSDWQTEPEFTASGLTAATEYTFVVRARDALGNVTADSVAASATTEAPDLTAPTPDPMTFASPPTANGSDSVTMTATTATDESGVEYYFECVSANGNDSGWQDSPEYTDTGLTPEIEYQYRVRARDRSAAQNPTAWSATLSATPRDSSTLDTITVLDSGTFTTNGAYPFAAVAALDASAASKIVVTLSDEEGFGDSLPTGVSFGGQDFTLAIADADDIQHASIYFLDATTVGGTFGTGDLVVEGSGSNDFGGSWLLLSGTTDGTGPANSATAASVALTTSINGSIVIAAHANNNSGATAQAPLTPLLDDGVGSAGGGSGYAIMATAGSETYAFAGGSSRPVTTAVAFEPAADSGGGDSAFDSWAATFPSLGDPSPSLDFDGGGLATALEWVLGGDPTDPADDLGLRPTLDTTSDPDGKFRIVFRRTAEAAADGNTTAAIEYAGDLIGWTTALHEGTGPDDITIDVDPDGFGSGIDRVIVSLPPALTSSGDLFARLVATVITP